MMRSHALCLLVIYGALLTLVSGIDPLIPLQRAELQGSVKMPMRLTRFTMTLHHFTCTLPLNEPLDNFALLITTDKWCNQFKIWSMSAVDVIPTINGMARMYTSQHAMYPPRAVINFHCTNILPEINANCTFYPEVPQLDVFATSSPRPLINPTMLSTFEPQGISGRQACKIISEVELSDFFLGDVPHAGPNHTELPPLPTRFPDFSRPSRPPRPGPVPETTMAPPPPLETMIMPRFGPREKRFVRRVFPQYDRKAMMAFRFLNVQRSGSVVSARTASFNTWFKTSGTFLRGPGDRDFSHGFYNGNDNVKLTLTTAFTVSTLIRSHKVWFDTYEGADLLVNLNNIVISGKMFLDNAWDFKNQVLYTQIGDFGLDRSVWEPAHSSIYETWYEQGKWPIYTATTDRPGSDVAAEVTSAYVLMYRFFTGIELGFENDALLTKAKQLYTFATTYRGKYTDHIPLNTTTFPVYESSGYVDELCVAAADLFLITQDDTYLEDAEKFFSQADSAMIFDWDKKMPLCAVLLYEATGGKQYEEYVQEFLSTWMDLPQTPLGLSLMPDQTISVTANAVFIALQATELKMFSGKTKFEVKLLIWCFKQVNYILGHNDAKISFLTSETDITKKSSRNPIHKNSACPSIGPCGWNLFNSEHENTHQLSGALVGGPDIDDQFTDSRQNTVGNSVAIEYNAGITAALVGLQETIQRLQNTCDMNTEFTSSTAWTTESSTWPSSSSTWSPFPSTESTTPETTTTTTPFPPYTEPSPTKPPSVPTVFNYSHALANSIKFFEAQKDITEGTLSGGWFDDGSFVKTTYVMAHASTMLAWGALQFRGGYFQSSQMDALLTSLKTPLTYFTRIWDSDNTNLLQKVADESYVRAFWSRQTYIGNQMVQKPVYLNDKGYPTGAEIVGEVTTALAVGSLLYRKTDPKLSVTLLDQATEMYQKMGTFNGEVFYEEDSKFYKVTSDVTDERCIASIWMFRATGEPQYLIDAQKYPGVQVADMRRKYDPSQSKELSYHNKHILCQILLYESTGINDYKNAVFSFLNFWTEGEMGAIKTPQGLAMSYETSSLRYTANAAFVALLAADLGMNPAALRSWAKSQIDYMLGANDRAYSYQIGYGDRYPLRPHHRASSCANENVTCTWSMYNSPWPNPRTLTGALVAGPDFNDFHEDCRNNHIMNRVAIDINAGFQSALAGLAKYFSQDSAEVPKPTRNPEEEKPATKPDRPKTTTMTTTTTTTTKPPIVSQKPTTRPNSSFTKAPRTTTTTTPVPRPTSKRTKQPLVPSKFTRPAPKPTNPASNLGDMDDPVGGTTGHMSLPVLVMTGFCISLFFV